MVCLLFGALISATDPVAVLAIFKTVGAPRRLTMIFEGESIFNDGTALALFLVILGILLEWNYSPEVFLGGVGSFLCMLFGGIIFGTIFWVGFSKAIGYVKNDEPVEIALTIIMAHLTFILAEVTSHHLYIGDFHVQISWVIATAVAGIIVWNYGRYKISPRVEEYMEKFWSFFAFIANSLVFILMGLILSYIDIDFSQFVAPIFITIVVVAAARAISIYFPIYILNYFKLEEYIPLNWQHMLAWWSLRWALAVMMVLLIPGVGDVGYEKILAFQESAGWKYPFSVRDFIMVITIGSIMFTLFIKATTIIPLMKRLWIDKLHEVEEFEFYEGKILSHLKIIDKLKQSLDKGYLIQDEYDELYKNYSKELTHATKSLEQLIHKKWNITLAKKVLSLHALWIEKQHLKDLFHYNEINEKNFKYVLGKLARQIERLESGNEQLRSISGEMYVPDFFEKIVAYFGWSVSHYSDIYIRNRAKAIVTRKVIKELQELKKVEFGFDTKVFDEVIELYENFNTTANQKMREVFDEHKATMLSLESRLANKSLLKLEEHIVQDLYEKEIITPKLYVKFKEDIEAEMYKDVKTMM